MSDITVRVLSDDDWAEYKQARLTALIESPEAFVSDYETEAAFDDQVWHDRMKRAVRLVAEGKNGQVAGIASLRRNDDMFDNAGELFGLWVTVPLRGTGVATMLVRHAADRATNTGLGTLLYWVGTDNGRAVSFASSYGFRPTEYRRPMYGRNVEPDEEEMAMALALRT